MLNGGPEPKGSPLNPQKLPVAKSTTYTRNPPSPDNPRCYPHTGIRIMKPELTTAAAASNQSPSQDRPLSPRDQELFQQHLDAIAQHWNPRTPYESFLVTHLARLDCLYSRAEAMQFSLLTMEIDSNSNSNGGPLAIGCKSRLSRQRKSFTALLQHARDQRSAQQNKKSPNEPKNGSSSSGNNQAAAA